MEWLVVVVVSGNLMVWRCRGDGVGYVNGCVVEETVLQRNAEAVIPEEWQWWVGG